MLQQMLAEDKADMVREAVVKSLGIIMGYIDDSDKYSQVKLFTRKRASSCTIPKQPVQSVYSCCLGLVAIQQRFSVYVLWSLFFCRSLQGFELMLLSLGDPSERVVNAVHQVFIPAFAAWTTELGTLHTSLIPSLLARIEKLLKVKVTPDSHVKAERL